MGSLVTELEGPDGLHLMVERSIRHEKERPEFFLGYDGEGIYLYSDDAAALALAVLEAAGYSGDDLSLVGAAIRHLRANGLREAPKFAEGDAVRVRPDVEPNNHYDDVRDFIGLDGKVAGYTEGPRYVEVEFEELPGGPCRFFEDELELIKEGQDA